MEEVYSSGDDAFLRMITEIILKNISDEHFGAEELISQSGMTRYKVAKRLQSITGKNINQLIRETRLSKSLELLRDDSLTIAEIAYKTGFGSPAYFNKCFHDHYGCTPGQAKNKKEVVPLTRSLKVYAMYTVLLIILTGAIFFSFFYKPWFSGNKTSIAVMPFENLTNNPEWDYWGHAIQVDLISSLSMSEELEVRVEESVKTLLERSGIQSSFTPASLRIVSRKLGAEYYILGSIQKFEEHLRINASLVGTDKKTVKKSFEVNSNFINNTVVQQLIDTLRHKVLDYMLISRIIKKNQYYQHLFTSPLSLEAMKYYDEGMRSVPAARIPLLKKAMQCDSSFHRAALALEYAYSANNQADSSRIWLIRNFKNRFSMNEQDRLDAGWAYSYTFESPGEQINYLKGLSKLDEQDPTIHYLIGLIHCFSGEYDQAVPELENSLGIFKRWGDEFLRDPGNCRNFKFLGIAYHHTGKYRKEKKLYNYAGKFINGHPWYDLMNAMSAMNENDTAAVRRYIEDSKDHFRTNYGMTQAESVHQVGRYFRHAGLYEVAEKYLRESLSIDPENLGALIDYSDLCSSSGSFYDTELMERGMRLSPDRQGYYEFLAMKGISLYSLGNKEEGRRLINEAWNEAPFKVYKIKELLRK